MDILLQTLRYAFDGASTDIGWNSSTVVRISPLGLMDEPHHAGSGSRHISLPTRVKRHSRQAVTDEAADGQRRAVPGQVDILPADADASRP